MSDLSYTVGKVYSQRELFHLNRMPFSFKEDILFNDSTESMSFLFRSLRGYGGTAAYHLESIMAFGPGAKEGRVRVEYLKSIPLVERMPEQGHNSFFQIKENLDPN